MSYVDRPQPNKGRNRTFLFKEWRIGSRDDLEKKKDDPWKRHLNPRFQQSRAVVPAVSHIVFISRRAGVDKRSRVIQSTPS